MLCLFSPNPSTPQETGFSEIYEPRALANSGAQRGRKAGARTRNSRAIRPSLGSLEGFHRAKAKAELAFVAGRAGSSGRHPAAPRAGSRRSIEDRRRA